MKIKSIEIENFRSIKNLTIPFNSYGRNVNQSNTSFLVGINESGKSAILEAISLIKRGMEEVDYEKDCFLEAQDQDEYISITADLEIENNDFWKKQIGQTLNLDDEFVNQLEILSIKKTVYQDSSTIGSDFIIEINKNLPYFKYAIIPEQKTINGKVANLESIKSLSSLVAIPEELTEKNAPSYLSEGQKLLTKGLLERKIEESLEATFEANTPEILIWKASPEYLINETISLEKFKDKPTISIPLRNIFHLFGKTTDEKIKETIEKALKNQARRDELQNKISSEITKHVNKIWKEHKIKIRISINGAECQVHVEDKDKEFIYYTMNQRSDGFKQFISLILSLSTQNASHSLKGKIILIDEPEVHLHPSGVRYMRDEILKIGKNNQVIVATHSHYMVDTDCPERHWIVTKEKTKTSISQINDSTPIEDDAVLASAFGLDLFKELLPRYVIIVEGTDDKSILSYSITKFDPKYYCSIKVARGASKAYGIASLLSDERITAFFIFDDDKEGRDYKKKIIDNYPKSFSDKNVFTLFDIYNKLPQKCTLEDLLPFEFVKAFFETETNTGYNLSQELPLIKQIIDQNRDLRDHKEKLDSLKVKLSNKFLVDFDTKEKIEQKSDRLVKFISLLQERIEDYMKNQ
jgi:predicted ATP-dependent endonuclease of OLD family